MHCRVSPGKVCFYAMCGILMSCASASASELANSSIRIDVVEYDVKTAVEDGGGNPSVSSLLEFYENGRSKVVFSALFTPDGKKEFIKANEVLVPDGFQYMETIPGVPNPRNYLQLCVATVVRLQGFKEDAACFKFEREYAMGVEETMRLTPKTFVKSLVKRKKIDFEFDVPRQVGQHVVGGGWKEESPSKVYYVVAVRQD